MGSGTNAKCRKFSEQSIAAENSITVIRRFRTFSVPDLDSDGSVYKTSR